jgi:hypothetical protein
MLSIARMFHETGVPLEIRNSRITTWNELRNCNLILLGSPRTNPFLGCLQGEEPFVTHPDQIENRQAQPGEERFYRGFCHTDGKLVRRTEYAVVTRRPGIAPGRAVTMIAANHGKAIEGAGRFLTLEDTMGPVLESMQLEGATETPQRFQLLLRVEMMDVSDEVVDTTCLSCRVLSGSAARAGDAENGA